MLVVLWFILSFVVADKDRSGSHWTVVLIQETLLTGRCRLEYLICVTWKNLLNTSFLCVRIWPMQNECFNSQYLGKFLRHIRLFWKGQEHAHKFYLGMLLYYKYKIYCHVSHQWLLTFSQTDAVFYILKLVSIPFGAVLAFLMAAEGFIEPLDVHLCTDTRWEGGAGVEEEGSRRSMQVTKCCRLLW